MCDLRRIPGKYFQFADCCISLRLCRVRFKRNTKSWDIVKSGILEKDMSHIVNMEHGHFYEDRDYNILWQNQRQR